MSYFLKLFENLFNSLDSKPFKMSFKKRTHVMNDDVLALILCELPIKQLLRLESVSQQFRDCVDFALKRKTGIRLGKKFQNFRCSDENHSIVGGNIRRSVECRYNKYDHTYQLDKSLHSFGLILQKCPNIKALYLSECRINEEVFQVIADNCKQLKCLTLAAIFCTNDMEEWKRMTDIIAKLNLTHLAIVGEGYEYDLRHNCSHTQRISPQVNYLVSHLPSLEGFMTYWYSDHLDNLVSCLPPTIKSLHLIRCSQVSVSSLSLLNSGNFPYLKSLNIDLNFYGRSQETAIFQFICMNLNLENLVFYGDHELNSIEDLGQTSIAKFKLKVYDRCYSDYRLPQGFESLRSLYLINFTLFPNSDYMKRSFPQLRELTIERYHLRCECTDDCSDGESTMYFGADPRMDCFYCNPKCIKPLSKLSHLKRLRLFHVYHINAKAFKYFLHLPVLELPGCYNDTTFIEEFAEVCQKICTSRAGNPFALPFTIRGEEDFIKKLNDTIIDKYWSELPSNLFLYVREYRKKRSLNNY